MLWVDKCSEMWYCVIKSGFSSGNKHCSCCRKAPGKESRITLSGIRRDIFLLIQLPAFVLNGKEPLNKSYVQRFFIIQLLSQQMDGVHYHLRPCPI